MEKNKVKSWWQILTPRDDIIKRNAIKHPFFVDLGDTLQKGQLKGGTFSSPKYFFERSFLTEGLKRILETVSSRLLGKGGNPVLLLQARFGGGKTHALLTIYHALSAPTIAIECLKGIKNSPETVLLLEKMIKEDLKINIITFTGTHVDPLYDKTPWGEIATQLGKYSKIRAHDEQKISPGKKRLRELLEDEQPLIILMDEIIEYAAKIISGKQEKKVDPTQLLVFMQELSEVIATLPQTVLVITLPEQDIELYSEQVEKFSKKLKQVLGRLETVQTPINSHEIPLVIKKQIFSNVEDKVIVKSIMNAFQSTYEKLRQSFPFPQIHPEYQNKMIRTYPFHPILLEILLENWATIPSFQGIRGILRVLSLVISDLWEKKQFCPLILPSNVNLDNILIQKELLKHLDGKWSKVLKEEITNKDSRAKLVDENLGAGLKDLHLAQRMATSIFLSSMSDTEKSHGKTAAEIMLMNVSLQPEDILLDSILEKIKNMSWYLHHQDQRYFYSTKPNLNYYVMLREENIDPNAIEKEIKQFLIKMKNKKPRTHVWPKNASEIPDKPEIQLIILPLTLPYEKDETNNFIRKIYETAGKNSIRVRKNMIIAVAADPQHVHALYQIIRRYLALKQELNEIDSSKFPSDSEKLNKELSVLEETIPFKLLMTYRYVGLASREGMYWLEMELPKSSTPLSLTERIMAFLKEQQLVVDKLTPLYLLDRVFGEHSTEKTVQEMWNLFLSTPSFPILENESVLVNSIILGVKQGLFELKGVPSSKELRPYELTMDTIVINLTARIPADHPKNPLEESRTDKRSRERKKDVITSIVLQAEMTTPEISWHDFYRGVILPLIKNKNNAYIKIEISLEWESTEGITKEVLDDQIKESLSQLPLKIKRLDHSSE